MHQPSTLQALEPRVLLSASFNELEPNNRGGQGTVTNLNDGDAILVGQSVDKSDKDFFLVRARVDGLLHIRADASASTQVAVYRSDWGKLAETEPNDGVNITSFRAQSGEVYKIRVRAKEDSGSTYNVTISERPTTSGGSDNLPSTVSDSNSDAFRGSATPFKLNDAGAAVLTGSADKDDRDWFAFTAPNSDTIHVNVGRTSGPFAKLEIKDAAGFELAETEPNDGKHSVSFSASEGRTYFLRLRGREDSILSDYLVQVMSGSAPTNGGGTNGNEAPTVAIDAEPNNRESEAEAFRFNDQGRAQLLGTSVDKDDKDFFTFTADRSGLLSFTVGKIAGRFAKLEFSDAAQNDLFETQPNNGNNSGSINVTQGATYYVRLRAPSDAPSQYAVGLTLS